MFWHAGEEAVDHALAEGYSLGLSLAELIAGRLVGAEDFLVRHPRSGFEVEFNDVVVHALPGCPLDLVNIARELLTKAHADWRTALEDVVVQVDDLIVTMSHEEVDVIVVSDDDRSGLTCSCCLNIAEAEPQRQPQGEGVVEEEEEEEERGHKLSLTHEPQVRHAHLRLMSQVL